jgi:hypothetical protein
LSPPLSPRARVENPQGECAAVFRWENGEDMSVWKLFFLGMVLGLAAWAVAGLTLVQQLDPPEAAHLSAQLLSHTADGLASPRSTARN